MKQLAELVLDALQSLGYGVIESLELWNTEYRPAILSLPAGNHTITIGAHEINFRKISPLIDLSEEADRQALIDSDLID